MIDITFLSIRGKTIPSGLKDVMHQCYHLWPDAHFSLLSKNIDQEGKAEEALRICKEFLPTAKIIFSIDGLVEEEYWGANAQTDTRILLLLPFDYVYEDLENPEFVKRLTKGFDYVLVAGNRFSTLIPLEKEDALTIEKNVRIPLVDCMKDCSYQKDMKSAFYEKYPSCDGKKIVAFITTAKKTDDDSLSQMNMDSLLKVIPEDMVLITNNETLFEKSNQFDNSLISKFVYSKRLFSNNDMVCMSDYLITDDSFLWNCSKEAGKKTYYFPYTETRFKKYMSGKEECCSENLLDYFSYFNKEEQNSYKEEISVELVDGLKRIFDKN